MLQNISLKELEAKAFKSVFQDGIWDIYLGLMLSAAAISRPLCRAIPSLSDSHWAIAAHMSILMTIYVGLHVAKRVITVPRMGRVKFGPRTRPRLNKMRVVMALSVLITVAMVALTIMAKSSPGGRIQLAHLLAAIWFAKCVIISSVVAYFLGYRRLYVIGPLYGVSLPLFFGLGEYSPIRPIEVIAFGMPGAAIVLMGVVVLVRFLRSHPIPVPDTHGPSA